MKGLVLVVAATSLGLTGCWSSAPKREMRQPTKEEFAIPPVGYDKPPEIGRDDPILTPKVNTAPILNTGAGPGGAGSPSPSGSPGGLRTGR